MQSGARVSEDPDARRRESDPIVDRRDAELAAIALLCLMFASTTEDPDRPQQVS